MSKLKKEEIVASPKHKEAQFKADTNYFSNMYALLVYIETKMEMDFTYHKY